MHLQKITPFFWFDSNAEEAANHYVSIFKNAKIVHVTRYGEAGKEIHGRAVGSVMTVSFEIEGQSFTAINGGSHFTINEAISFIINCDSQEEVDYYWSRLTEGGDPAAQQCGWLKDKFGVSWQVVPTELFTMLDDPDRERAERVMSALLQMKKLDLNALREVYRS